MLLEGLVTGGELWEDGRVWCLGFGPCESELGNWFEGLGTRGVERGMGCAWGEVVDEELAPALGSRGESMDGKRIEEFVG